MLTGWIVILTDGNKKKTTPSCLVSKLLKQDEFTEVIPIFKTKLDAEYYAAILCKKHDYIKDTLIFDISSVLNKAHEISYDILMKDRKPSPNFLDRIKNFWKKS
jgi:mitochondrial fission protein ELM1